MRESQNRSVGWWRWWVQPHWQDDDRRGLSNPFFRVPYRKRKKKNPSSITFPCPFVHQDFFLRNAWTSQAEIHTKHSGLLSLGGLKNPTSKSTQSNDTAVYVTFIFILLYYYLLPWSYLTIIRKIQSQIRNLE